MDTDIYKEVEILPKKTLFEGGVSSENNHVQSGEPVKNQQYDIREKQSVITWEMIRKRTKQGFSTTVMFSIGSSVSIIGSRPVLGAGVDFFVTGVVWILCVVCVVFVVTGVVFVVTDALVVGNGLVVRTTVVVPTVLVVGATVVVGASLVVGVTVVS